MNQKDDEEEDELFDDDDDIDIRDDEDLQRISKLA